MAARQLAKLAGSCDFFLALGDNDVGERAREELVADAVHVHAATRATSTREGICLVDPSGERTILTLGPRLEPRGSDALPWDRVAGADAVYVTAGDEEALRRARTARIVVVSSRHLSTLAASGSRPTRWWEAASILRSGMTLSGWRTLPRVWSFRRRGRPVAATGERTVGKVDTPRFRRPVRISDTYGSGDSFQAALTFALGAGYDVSRALELAARCGSAALTGRGPAEGQLTAAAL